MLEHPSSSRLHAVLQYNGETRVAYLYDANSAHGTFLNRRRVKPGMHVPVRCWRNIHGPDREKVKDALSLTIR